MKPFGDQRRISGTLALLDFSASRIFNYRFEGCKTNSFQRVMLRSSQPYFSRFKLYNEIWTWYTHWWWPRIDKIARRLRDSVGRQTVELGYTCIECSDVVITNGYRFNVAFLALFTSWKLGAFWFSRQWSQYISTYGSRLTSVWRNEGIVWEVIYKQTYGYAL